MDDTASMEMMDAAEPQGQAAMEAMPEASWFPCPGCDRVVTGLVRDGHPHPGKHHYYSYTHCCLHCEAGHGGHDPDQWACAGMPRALFGEVQLPSSTRTQRYLLHDPGGTARPALLFLHGANTYLYPETLWWDLRELLEKNNTVRNEFIVVAPFGSIGEPVARPSSWDKKNRFGVEVPYVECFEVDATWETFLAALRALGPGRVDAARLHATGYSMGGQATWGLTSRFGSRLASAAPMAARCAWEPGAWDREDQILAELKRLPIWCYCGEEDTRTVSWRDFWWLADKRGRETKAARSVAVGGEEGVEATVHDWGADLQLGLVRGTRSCHCIWGPVLHDEATFGLFTRMLAARCETPMPPLESGCAAYPASVKN